MLNPHQFASMRREDDFADLYDEHDPLYHGTTPENAESISHTGFAYGEMRNGHASGAGVYFHRYPSQTHQYGPATVEARPVRELEVHRNPWNDRQLYMEAASRAKRAGNTAEDHISQVSHELGYRGHMDPDDGAMVVYNPDHLNYVGHEILKPRERR